jgi:hypothetical protein
MAMFVNREPVDGLAALVRPVGVPIVVLHVHAIVKGLAEPNDDRLEQSEKAIQERRTEIRVMNEVVRDAVDVPGNANRINEPEDQHDPERRAREQEEHPEEVGAMKQPRGDRDRVPAGKHEDPGIGLEPLGGNIVYGMPGWLF